MGSSEEEEEEEASEDEREIASSTSNGQGLMPPPPPPQMPSFNLAVQQDSEEQPVSFDDLPSSTHVILTTNKHRAKLPSRRRPTGKGHVANGNGHVASDSNGNGHDRLALPSEENDYDGDESEMSYSHIKRGRRSMKRKQPPMRTGIPLSTFAHKNSDSDEKQIVHSKNCDSSNGSDRLLEAEQKRKAEEVNRQINLDEIAAKMAPG